MTEREQIHDYLKSLSNYLSRLDKSNADEVIREIESHIFDAIELQQQNGQQVDAQIILEGFGDARELANQYVEHMLRGSPPPTGFKAIQKVKKGVTKSLYYSMGLFGFAVSIFFIMIGLAKLFVPEMIGVWSAAAGNSVIITFSEGAYPHSREILGYWLIPISIALGLAIARLTRAVLKILKQSLY